MRVFESVFNLRGVRRSPPGEERATLNDGWLSGRFLNGERAGDSSGVPALLGDSLIHQDRVL
jgi:hypothetical protein